MIILLCCLMTGGFFSIASATAAGSPISTQELMNFSRTFPITGTHYAHNSLTSSLIYGNGPTINFAGDPSTLEKTSLRISKSSELPFSVFGTLVNAGVVGIGQPPVIVCPSNIMANNDPGLCSATVSFSPPVVTDPEDGVLTAIQIAGPASGSAFPVGITVVEFSATDSDGNTVTCQFNVTVVDNQDPLAICKNVTIDLDSTGLYTLTPAEIDNGSSDNCGIATYALGILGPATGSLTTTFIGGNALAGSMFDLEAINGLTIDSFDVNMPSNQTADIEVYYKTGTWVGSESTPASWTLVGTAANITSAGVGLPTPLNLNLGINVAAGARVAFYVTRTAGSLTYTNGTTVGALFASDSNLQMFEGAGKGYPFASTFQPRNFNGNIVYSTASVITPFSGALDCSNIGTNDIYLLVTDNSGNTSNCLATVTVQDVTAPDVLCVGGGGLDVYLDANGVVVVDANDLVQSVTEACGGYTVMVAGGAGGGGAPSSITTLFVSDNGGSPGWIQFFDITVGPENIDITDLDVNTSGTSAITMQIYTLIGTYVGNELNAAAWGAPVTTGTGTGAGSDNPSSITLASSVTLNANTTYGIGIQMDASPRYTNGTGCPGNQCYSNADLSIALGSVVAGQFTGSFFTPRIFNGTINYTKGPDPAATIEYTCADLGGNSVEVFVTDSSGNTATCMAVINVIDTTPPVIVCAATPADIQLGTDGTATIDPYSLIQSVNDACGGISALTVDIPQVTCADIGAPITITISVSDASGNVATCTTQVNVVDTLVPEITCPNDQTVNSGTGNQSYILPDYFGTGEATATDNCTDPLTITTQDPAAGTALSDGTYTITLTAEDESGNISTCTFELNVEPKIGVDENNLESGLSLYPNPAENIVNLVNKTNIALDRMVIFDINGKKVNQIDLRSMQGEKSVDVSNLASGVYMIQIIGENASTIKRMIKE